MTKKAKEKSAEDVLRHELARYIHRDEAMQGALAAFGEKLEWERQANELVAAYLAQMMRLHAVPSAGGGLVTKMPIAELKAIQGRYSASVAIEGELAVITLHDRGA